MEGMQSCSGDGSDKTRLSVPALTGALIRVVALVVIVHHANTSVVVLAVVP